MNYSCQEEYDYAMQWEAEYEAQMQAEQEEAESEQSCCWTRITDTWLCVECWEHCG